MTNTEYLVYAFKGTPKYSEAQLLAGDFARMCIRWCKSLGCRRGPVRRLRSSPVHSYVIRKQLVTTRYVLN